MAYTQKERMCRVVSPFGDDALLLQRMAAHESVSGLFRYDLDLLSEREDLAFARIVGKPIGVSVRLGDGSERWFHGVVARFEHGAASGRFVAYRAEVVPWLWLLTRRAACRIFQHMTVPDIAKKLFSELGFSDYKLELVGTYPEREYCVQYRETDFNFVSRLLEDAGISYFFEHQEKSHTLVLFDSPDANAPCPSQSTAIYQSGAGSAGAPAGDVRNLCYERELRPGAYALTDYNFEQPGLSLLTATSSSACVGSSGKLEVYDYPGDFLQLPDAKSRVKCRMEAEECASVRVRGASDCASFTPGYRFDLKGHYRKDCNDSYLLTDVTHFATDTVGDEANGIASYENQFVSIPHSIPYRPQRTTPKPVVHGVQTATVVGAGGKEIDVDEHARVVVQFHWDREGKKDDKSSCRVRVAQNWAGKGWGLIAHPRIGQEVIVEFLEGDPDRPIITGRVYNGEQVAPYGLPANSTQSGIKSRSSPGGAAANFNEIRFEDKKGSEIVYVQSEKDRTTLTKNDDAQEVGHDRKRKVGNDETIEVVHDRTRKVGNDESVNVTKNQLVDVGENRTRSVGKNERMSIGDNRSVSVGKNHDESIGESETLSVGKSRTRSVTEMETISIGKDQSLSVDGDRSLTVNKGQVIQIQKDQQETIGGRYQTSVTKEYMLQAQRIVLQADEQITIKTGDAQIVMKSSGDISVSGSKITIKGSGDVVVSGSKILHN